jgi:hypothetical protein
MLVPDDQPAHSRTAEHYHQYRQQLTKKGVGKKPHGWVKRVVNKEFHFAGGSGSPLVGDGRGWRWEVVEEGSEGGGTFSVPEKVDDEISSPLL